MKTKLLLFALLLVVALPAAAQGAMPHTVTFDGIRFSYDNSLAGGVNITAQAGDAETTFPPEVGHVQFLLYVAPPVPESLFDAVGGLRVYRVADFAQPGFEAAAGQLEQLQNLIAASDFDLAVYQTDVAESPNLPFMPVIAAGQTLRAQAAYLGGDNVYGIRYVTAWQEAAEPLLSHSLLYTFQGLSQDGAYYISAIFPLETALLPAETAADFDMAIFVEGLAQYQADTTAALNAAAPGDFSPALDQLDALVQSIAFAD